MFELKTDAEIRLPTNENSRNRLQISSEGFPDAKGYAVLIAVTTLNFPHLLQFQILLLYIRPQNQHRRLPYLS